MNAALEQTLEIFKPVFSPRQPASQVEAVFSKLNTKQQIFAHHIVKVIAASNVELAFVFACYVGLASHCLSERGLKSWVAECLHIYDREGLYPATKALKEYADFQKKYLLDKTSCTIEEVKPKLGIFLHGLIGRELKVQSAEHTYTDTATIYLPQRVSRYRDKNKNRALYKSMACFLWAQTWYGTFKRTKSWDQSTQERLAQYDNSERAQQLFLSLENIRLLANIQRDLPGLYREMSQLSPLLEPKDKTWLVLCKRLKREKASVEDTFTVLDILIKRELTAVVTDYQGGLYLDEVAKVSKERQDSITQKIKKEINNKQLQNDQIQGIVDNYNQTSDDATQGQASDSALSEDNDKINLTLQRLIRALQQDIEQISFDDLKGLSSDDSVDALLTPDESGVIPKNQSCVSIHLDEWDYRRQNYRVDWCQVHLKTVEPIDDGFRQQTLEKYAFVSSQIHRVFEAMRDQPKSANRQKDGEHIDFDAMVEMKTALKSGEEVSERLYVHQLHTERSVAVCLLIDMSGSTKGWINLAMRESLILFCEALNILGDQYSILGFSGMTRQRCEIYNIKGFSDNHHNTVHQRIAKIQAKDYTRMGFAIRYAAAQLGKVECKHRILLMLSDGKPDDYDGYQGEYGIQDTRKAILEAQGRSISPFSITIDKQAQNYLPRLFGPGQYTILKDVSLLPLKLSEIFRKLST